VDQPPLNPGEIRFEAENQQPPLRQGDRRRERRKTAAILIGTALFFIVCGVGSYYQDRNQIKVPARPTPPPAVFARFDISGPSNNPQITKTLSAVAFAYEPVVVLLVPPHRIPPEDAAQASNFSSRSGLRFASSESSRPPYILQGDVHIAMGALIGHDVGMTRLRIDDGALTQAYLSTSQGGPRGPPPPRRIYIQGTINSFDGPEQMQQSVLDNQVLDLGPSAEARAAYEQDVRKFEDEIKRLSEKTKVPPEELREVAGKSIKVDAGHVVQWTDVEGVVMDRGNDGSWKPRNAEAGVKGREQIRERAMEPHPVR
jgi:hypothetical protein